MSCPSQSLKHCVQKARVGIKKGKQTGLTPQWDFNLAHIPLIHPHCGVHTCCLDNGEATAMANYVLLDGGLDTSSGMKCLI